MDFYFPTAKRRLGVVGTNDSYEGKNAFRATHTLFIAGSLGRGVHTTGMGFFSCLQE